MSTTAQQIAERLLGQIDWKDQSMGFCTCPGEHLHTTGTAENHCAVYLNGLANVACFHHSCEAIRDKKSEELRGKLGNNFQASWRSSWDQQKQTRQKPSFRPEKLNKLAGRIEEPITAEWLAARSPVAVENLTPHQFLSHIYRPGEQVLVFVGRTESQGTALWPNEGFRTSHENGVWFQAQPVDGKWRRKRMGQSTSRRTAECCTSFPFLVIESDIAEPDLWLRALVQIRLPIAAIYHSGGRSIHALLELDAATKEEWEQRAALLKPGLIELGADPASLTAVRLTRLPNAHRGTRKQQLLYLNPSPKSEPIYARQ